ncbi:rac-like GTP-binding protein 3 isoform X2 [Juglans regia]|uniref:Rac-like GTP-binding protein 3 isoform X2 n=1 Tax=Juglans regia TaxID=51240 RepID=A0A6P9F780_JUGRE|nr:rac-like GTP-binding protein 3 isoform X2 [Juglans regia]
MPVTTAQGVELSKQIGATYYIQCSSRTQQRFFYVCEDDVIVRSPRDVDQENGRNEGKRKLRRVPTSSGPSCKCG